MTAIITQDFKNQIIKNLQDDLTSGDNKYYVGIGKPVDWNNPNEALPNDIPHIPLNSDQEIRNAKINTISIKAIEASSMVAQRFNWSAGMVYYPYNDVYEYNQITNNNQNRYYVMNNQYEVYVCLYAPKDSLGEYAVSQEEPTLTDTEFPFRLSDGYIWKYLYTIGALEANQFLGANLMPVKQLLSTDVNADENGIAHPDTDGYLKKQWEVQQNAVPGQIIGYEIINGGTDYDETYPPNLYIHGDGIGASAIATVVNGVITDVQVEITATEPQPQGGTQLTMSFGSGYTYATVEILEDNLIQQGGIAAGSGAIIRPIFAAKNGIGADPRADLKASSLMLNTQTDGDEGGDWIIDNDFRQITILKNPLDNAVPADIFIEPTGNPLKTITLDNVTEGFIIDNEIICPDTTARAYIVKKENIIENNQIKIWYLQDENTGFIPFEVGDTINEISGLGEGNITELDSNPEVNIMPAEVLYIDNRAPISRDANQEEDIKIIIRI